MSQEFTKGSCETTNLYQKLYTPIFWEISLTQALRIFCAATFQKVEPVVENAARDKAHNRWSFLTFVIHLLQFIIHLLQFCRSFFFTMQHVVVESSLRKETKWSWDFPSLGFLWSWALNSTLSSRCPCFAPPLSSARKPGAGQGVSAHRDGPCLPAPQWGLSEWYNNWDLRLRCYKLERQRKVLSILLSPSLVAVHGVRTAACNSLQWGALDLFLLHRLSWRISRVFQAAGKCTGGMVLGKAVWAAGDLL